MRTPRTLTARLVVTAVALVAVVSLLIAAVTTLAIRSSLMDRLDTNVQSSVRRVGDQDREGDPGDGTSAAEPEQPGSRHPDRRRRRTSAAREATS